MKARDFYLPERAGASMTVPTIRPGEKPPVDLDYIALAAEDDPPPEPLIGAAAIGAEIGLDARQIYHLATKMWTMPEDQRPPIRRLPGLGLCSDARLLRRWWSTLFPEP